MKQPGMKWAASNNQLPDSSILVLENGDCRDQRSEFKLHLPHGRLGTIEPLACNPNTIGYIELLVK